MTALRRDLGYKLLSLLLAVILYGVAFLQNNPRMSQEILIQPEIEKLPENMAIKKKPEALSVTVTGNIQAIQAFRQQAIKASLDLSHGEEGVNRISVRYQNDPSLIEVNGPGGTEVALEKKTWRSFTIQPQYNDSPPLGYAFKEAVVRPRQARVRGMESEIKKVDSVVAMIENNGPFAGLVELVAFNRNREAVDTVEIEPAQVMVTLEVKTAPVSKMLVLSPVWIGRPAAGYAITNYSFEPLSVTVAGPAVELINTSRLSVSVNISGLQTSVTRTMTLAVPPGMRVIDPPDGKAQLRLDIAPISAPSGSATASPTPPTVASPSPPVNPPLKENP
jgi:YbbR domain-containing protein